MNLLINRLILYAVAASGLLALLLVPKGKRKLAYPVFLFQSTMSRALGLTVVEAGLLNYPVREFTFASHTSFTFEYLVYPVIAVYYNLYYPERGGLWKQAGWLFLFTGGITLPEHFIEKYTELIDYTGWAWYWTFISVGATLCLSRLFTLWFFREGGYRQGEIR